MHHALLGRTSPLTLRRIGALHATLATDHGDTVDMALENLPPEAATGDVLRVFVHQGSDGRPIATTRRPKIERGEVAFLPVTALVPFGAFFDWGMRKELLVPFAEQISDLTVGERHPIGLVLDKNGRLCGTMRTAEMLHDPCGDFAVDQTVDGEAWRNDPDIGLFVIVGRRFVGLLPATEPHTLTRGEAARFRVSRVLPDGRIVLTLRGPAHAEIERDAEHLLEVLSRPDAPRVNDKSDPELIRARFGLAKKAFKRAAGRLLKEQTLEIDGAGFYRPFVATPTSRR